LSNESGYVFLTIFLLDGVMLLMENS